MAIKFEKIQAGMTLWQRGTYSGAAKSEKGEWRVSVLDVYPEKRSARVSWNGNAPTTWPEHRLTRLFTRRMEAK